MGWKTMLAIFLDTETTGLDPFFHRILEIAFKIVDPATGEEKLSYQAVVKQPWEVWEKRDLDSIEFNGFTWDKVNSGKEERFIREEIIQILTDFNIARGTAVFICQNPAFDRNFFAQIIDVYTQEQLNWPYHWLDLASMFWALMVKDCQRKKDSFPIEMNLSKNAIALRHQLPVEASPHGALNGVDHLLLCYRVVVGFSELTKG
jgi:oligoribonuclease